MKKVLRMMSYILVAALASAATLLVMPASNPGGYNKLAELRSLIDQKFIGDIDWKTVDDYAAAGMIEGLGDRWSYYMSAESYANYKE